MIRRLLFLLLLSVISFASVYSQGGSWAYVGNFPNEEATLFGNNGASGVAVDPDGKVWVIPYKPFKPDSVFVPDSNKYLSACPVYAFYPDGSPAPFSPIKLVQTRELKNKVLSKAKTGIAADNKGNIIVCDYDELVKIDYKTGEGMNWKSFTPNDNSPLCKPAIDASGNVFVSFCYPEHPIILLTSDFTFQDTIIKNLKDSGRTTDISLDGNTVFAHRSGAACTYVYSRASEFDQFELVDTVFKGFKIESSCRSPLYEILYISCGSFNDMPVTDPQIPGLFIPDNKVTPGKYYGIYLPSFSINDTLSWRFSLPGSKNERNSGIAFGKSWNYAYLTSYGGDYYPVVQIFKWVHEWGNGDKVEKEPATIVKDFSLSQNYPNPFNPETEIRFSVAEDGPVTLKIYDLLGNEIYALVNERLSAGNYSTKFIPKRNISSGIYIYRLSQNKNVLSRKMTFMK